MKTTYLYIGLIVLIVVGLVAARNMSETQTETVTGKYDDFAQCLTDAGAKFYGAWWCPHCNDQKKLFENSKKLPYIECSTPSKQPLQVCIDAGVESFPTWIFSDGSKLEGLHQFEDLAAKTNCVAPAM
jgi:glutaredoxin